MFSDHNRLYLEMNKRVSEKLQDGYSAAHLLSPHVEKKITKENKQIFWIQLIAHTKMSRRYNGNLLLCAYLPFTNH